MLFLQLSSQTNHFWVILEKNNFFFIPLGPGLKNFGNFDQPWALVDKKKLVFLKLLKSGWSESLAVKTSYFTN